MKYFIMLLIVIGLAAADFLTGCIKAYVKDDIKSVKMRKGGLNKLTEIVVMGVAIGSEIGFGQLGKYYGHQELGDIAGGVTAIAVFAYIAVMELVSILENYAEINPQAAWIRKLVKKLSNVEGNDNSENE